MDRRNKTNQDRRVGQRSNEERQDRAEGGKAQSSTKETTVQQIDSYVMAQVFAHQLFDFGEGKHCVILHYQPAYHFFSTRILDQRLLLLLSKNYALRHKFLDKKE